MILKIEATDKVRGLKSQEACLSRVAQSLPFVVDVHVTRATRSVSWSTRCAQATGQATTLSEAAKIRVEVKMIVPVRAERWKAFPVDDFDGCVLKLQFYQCFTTCLMLYQ